jgi:glucosamine--fructose-6-phosphate aminotransferase (isomerizing)
MCGIIGYIGNRPCVDLLFSGLQTLEYRGYDSAGIAVEDGKKLFLVKAAGKLNNLQPLLTELPSKSTFGMGHTRWATHGPPVTKNAHPHVTEGLAIVHNGIIENYRDLKAGLESAGVQFSSDTDTEVVLHLLRKELTLHKDPRQAVLSLLSKLKGAFSLGIMIPGEVRQMYLVKLGSPLVVGLGNGENFFASDAAALIKHTKRTVVLKDGQFARLSEKGLELWDFAGKTLPIEESILEWSAESIEKGGFATFMLKEIHEQPAVISKMIGRFVDLNKLTLNTNELGLNGIDLDRVRHVHIVGCGTAYFSGAVGRYVLEPTMGMPINVELASEFRYRNPHVGRDSLVIAISQSGETLDTLECVKFARAQGAQVLSICNKRHTEIPRHSDATLFMDCGPEIGVASTKAFTAMVFSQYLLSLAFNARTKRREGFTLTQHAEQLRRLPHLLQQAVDLSDKVAKVSTSYYENSQFLFIGRGTNCPIAYEGALKLKEISYIHAEGYGAGELKHGPIALVDRHMPVMVIVAKDRYYDKTIANIEEVRARDGQVVGLGPESDPQLSKLCNHVIECPQIDNEAFQALINVIPLQLFAYHVAVLRGTDVDKPRNLAKSVTVE